MNSKNLKKEILISLTTLLLGWQFASAQGTGFTYQGRLIDGTNAANGSYDLSFTLYDSATSGNALGSVTNYATPVSNGLFFATLDFGPGDFVFLLDENEIHAHSFEVEGITPLDRTTWHVEQRRLKNALAPLKTRGVKVLPYTLDKQSL